MNAATDYVKAGLALVPLRSGTKKPLKEDWTLKENAVTTTAQAEKLNGGIGLAHAWSGTCAFDIDDFFATIDWFQAQNIDVAALLQHPAAVKIDSGRQNRAKLLYRLPDGVAPPLTIKHLMPGGATMFELRCADSIGNSVHCVLPPSIHPDTGKPYKWVGDWHKIPVIPDELLSVWSGLIANHQRRAGDRPKAVSPEDLSDQTLIDLDSALATISSDSRETWISVGHALKGLGEYGYQLWLAWSRKSSAYRPGDEERWDSFDPKHTDYRAIFSRAARDHAWANPGYRWEEADDTRDNARDTSDNARKWPPPLDLVALAGREPLPPTFLIPDWLPAGYATLFAGHGGVGKSGIALHLAVCMAAGIAFFGLPVEQCRVLYLSCEDRERVLHWRLSRICAYLGVDLASLSGTLQIVDLVGEDSLLWDRDPRTGHTLSASYGILQSLVVTCQTEVLFIDGVSDTFGGNENARGEVKRYVNSLVALIPPERGAVLLIGHVAKIGSNTQGEGYSGSTGWHNSSRARWYLYPEPAPNTDNERVEHTGSLILELQKSNLGRTDQSIRFTWDELARLFVGKGVAGFSGFDRARRDTTERMGILRALQLCINVPIAKSGPRTAYHVLSAHPKFPDSLKLGKSSNRRFWRQIEELRAMRYITETSIRRSDRHYVCIFEITPEGVRACGQCD